MSISFLPLSIAVFALAPGLVLAHDGGLDGYGCHHNRSEGGYHCHRGQFAGAYFDSQAQMLERRGEVEKPAGSNPYPVSGRSFSGEVVAIADGDTITILTPQRVQMKVRLAEIDTPERSQPYGTRARQIVSELVFRKQVEVRVQDIDRYGRFVGRVYVDNVDVCAEMVSRGAAWVYDRYVEDLTLYDLQTEARGAKRGIWSLPESEQVPPWQWRSDRR